jgi:hypothetical protein
MEADGTYQPKNFSELDSLLEFNLAITIYELGSLGGVFIPRRIAKSSKKKISWFAHSECLLTAITL